MNQGSSLKAARSETTPASGRNPSVKDAASCQKGAVEHAQWCPARTRRRHFPMAARAVFVAAHAQAAPVLPAFRKAGRLRKGITPVHGRRLRGRAGGSPGAAAVVFTRLRGAAVRHGAAGMKRHPRSRLKQHRQQQDGEKMLHGNGKGNLRFRWRESSLESLPCFPPRWTTPRGRWRPLSAGRPAVTS